ncbi:MAG: helix-hairpin-helix domain-containing protein, partial [Bacteroidetes bacterium]
MSFLRRQLLLVWLLLGSLFALAQDETGQEQIIQRRIETIAEQLGEGDENIDYNTLLDELLIFSENPININTATFTDLTALPMLDEIAVANLLKHIETNGKLLNLYELQAVNGFSISLIRQLEPFIKVSDNPDAMSFSFKEMIKEGSHELVMRYQQVLNPQQGYMPIADSLLEQSPNSRYLGSQQKYWLRYRFRYSNKVSWGLTMEKDAGEEFFKGSMKQGFDFYSGHLFVQNLGVLKAAALGDFQAQFGQGLTFWSGLAFGKSSDGVSIKRSALGLRPYTSVDENRFLRGGGFTLQFNRFEVTAFGSYKLLDGNISTTNDTLTEQEESVSSIFSSGFHRTPGELQDRQSLTEAVYGGNVSYKSRRLSVGLTAVGYQFSKPIQRSDDLYNIFEFSGKQNSNFGLDYSYIFRNFHFFGEFAISQNLGFAT